MMITVITMRDHVLPFITMCDLLAGTPSYITRAPWVSSVSSLPAWSYCDCYIYFREDNYVDDDDEDDEDDDEYDVEYDEDDDDDEG